MTVSTSTNSVVYRGNGATTQFAVPFKVLDEDHLLVRRRVYATGVVEETYVGTDYSYVGVGDPSGTLTLAGTALDDDYELVIERVVPYTQDLDIVNAGGFYPETVEEQLDLIVMGVQRLADLAGRGAVVPVGETGLELSKVADRAGKFWAFDADGQFTVSEGTGADSGLRTDLAASTGAALIGVTGGGTLQDFLNAPYIDAGNTLTPGPEGAAFTVVGGGNADGHAYQGMFVNERSGLIGGSDRANEVHIGLWAKGGAVEHRIYLDFIRANGVIAWLTGKNANDCWILNHDADGHRFFFIPTTATAPYDAYAGHTYISASGSGAIALNDGPNDGDTFSAEGFYCTVGGDHLSGARAKLFQAHPHTYTAGPGLTYNNNAGNPGGGYAPSSLGLFQKGAAIRGSGIYTYNEVADKGWFFGNAYNSNYEKFSVCYLAGAAFDPTSADVLNEVFGVSSAGVLNVIGEYQVDGTKVLGNQGAAVADAAGGATVDAEARTAINTWLARARVHGIIAT